MSTKKKTAAKKTAKAKAPAKKKTAKKPAKAKAPAVKPKRTLLEGEMNDYVACTRLHLEGKVTCDSKQGPGGRKWTMGKACQRQVRALVKKHLYTEKGNTYTQKDMSAKEAKAFKGAGDKIRDKEQARQDKEAKKAPAEKASKRTKKTTAGRSAFSVKIRLFCPCGNSKSFSKVTPIDASAGEARNEVVKAAKAAGWDHKEGLCPNCNK